MVNWGYFTPLSEGYYALLTTGFPGPPCVLPEFHYLYIYFSSAAIHLSNPSIHPHQNCLWKSGTRISEVLWTWFNPHCGVASHLGPRGKMIFPPWKKKVPSYLKRCHIPNWKRSSSNHPFSGAICVRFGDDSWKTTSGFLHGALFM